MRLERELSVPLNASEAVGGSFAFVTKTRRRASKPDVFRYDNSSEIDSIVLPLNGRN